MIPGSVATASRNDDLSAGATAAGSVGNIYLSWHLVSLWLLPWMQAEEEVGLGVGVGERATKGRRCETVTTTIWTDFIKQNKDFQQLMRSHALRQCQSTRVGIANRLLSRRIFVNNVCDIQLGYVVFKVQRQADHSFSF